jgi:signal transduction histidine kinase/CheY-like chemotaxis protein
MHLDAATAMALYAMLTLVMALPMLLYWSQRRSIHGLGHWVLGMQIGGIGAFAIFLRPLMPLWLSVLIGNLGVIFGASLIYAGFLLFNQRKVHWVPLLLWSSAMIVLLMHDVLTSDNLALRIQIISVFCVPLYSLTAYEAYRATKDTPLSFRIFAPACFVMLTVASAIRGLDATFKPIQATMSALESPMQAVMFLIGGIANVMIGTVMINLANEFLRHQLEEKAETVARIAQDRDAAAQAAETANRAKTIFLATLSHEIRTPVNAMIGGVELLQAHNCSDQSKRRVLEAMEKSGHAMMALIDDLLDISKIEAGGLALQPEPIDLRQKLRDALDIVMPRAAAKGLTVTLLVDEAVPRWVEADPARLRQIVLNLLGNAVKFTDKGGVRLQAMPVPDLSTVGEGRFWLRIAVADTGIGIPKEQIEKIFDPFYQVDSGDKRRFGGVGLGLTICQRLAQAMDGHLALESAGGLGSIFILDIPVGRAAAPRSEESKGEVAAARPYDGGTFVGMRALLVEDDEVNRLIASALLREQGFETVEAADGATALTLATATPLSVILMDLSMPGMDGFETTRRLRLLGGTLAHVPVIALTANVLPETVLKAKAAGMQDFIGKPIRRETLMAAITSAVSHTVDRSTPPAASKADAVLLPIADVDAPLRAAAQRALRQAADEGHLRLLRGEGGFFRRLQGVERVAEGAEAMGMMDDAEALRQAVRLAAQAGSDAEAERQGAWAAAEALLASLRDRLNAA